jgi:protein-tyrosine phosphatase
MVVSDLHVHLLPGLDDGPSDEDEAIALAAKLAGDGVRRVATTPHLRGDYPDVRPDELAARTAALQERIDGERIDLDLVTAGEVAIEWAMAASDDDLRLVSYGQRGQDVLIETPYGPLPAIFEELLLRVTDRGYRILLAHPERNHTLQNNPERLGRMVEQGVLVQITASALASSERRSRSRRLARDLLRDGHAHVIASDSHGAIQRAALSQGVAAASELAPNRAQWMVTEAPHAIVMGEPLPEAPVDAAPKRLGFLDRLRR